MSKSWQKQQPQVLDWLETLHLNHLQSANDAANDSFIACSATKKGDDWVVNSSHSKKSDLQKAVQDMNWQGGQPITVSVSGTNFIVATYCELKVTEHQKARQWGLDVAKVLKNIAPKSILLDNTSSEAFVGLSQGLHQSNNFKKPKKAELPATVEVVGIDKDQMAASVHLCKSMSLTRFIQDAPANWLTPTKFAEIGSDVAKAAGLEVKIFGQSELEANNMNIFLAVAQGSIEEPKMIVIEKKGSKKPNEYFSLVGKGLTFDAGGISIKPSAGMGEMKYDMSGGAAVLGAMHYLSHFDFPMSVVAAIGCTENMCSGSAIKPGDVVTGHKGKSVEILNTDAEGRLVLADVLSYVCEEYKPEYMINAATLTGSVLHALGGFGSAIMSNNDQFSAEVMQASKNAGEPMWPLPLWPESDRETKADCGDLANIAKPSIKAGSIMAGAFLKQFVDEKVKWAHLDIAGTAWGCKAVGYPASAGTAFGLRTMAETCIRLNK